MISINDQSDANDNIEFTVSPNGTVQSPDKNYARVKFAEIGQQVRIVTPRYFVRCGYPLCADDVTIKFRDEVDQLTSLAAKAIGAVKRDGSVHYDIEKRLKSAVVSMIMRRERFGGNERRVYELESPEMMGLTAKVTAKKMHQTGTYSKGYYHSTMDGPEYDPPTLESIHTHCIYTVEFTSVLRWPVRIDAVNCEIVQ